MTYYEIFQLGPAVYIPLIVLSLVITLLGYGIFPIIFAKIRKKPITKKKYKLLCYGVNFLVAILFTILDEKFSAGPYLLWTFVFSSKGIKILKKRYLLGDFNPVEDLFGDKDEFDKPTTTSSDELPTEDTQSANQSQIVNIVEPTNNNNKNTKQGKVKYCSRCGSLIDSETKICSGCRKKYFKGIKFTKVSVTILILSLTLLISVIINLVQLSKTQYWVNNCIELKDDISDLENEVSDLENDIFDLEYKLWDYEELADFVDEYVVFVEDDGTNLYHKYECYKFKADYFWVFNIDAAKDNGYKQCNLCH